jgi:hypothetical protein
MSGTTATATYNDHDLEDPHVSHIALVVVPARPEKTTSSTSRDNLGAARGRLPDAAMRKRIEQFFDAL